MTASVYFGSDMLMSDFDIVVRVRRFLQEVPYSSEIGPEAFKLSLDLGSVEATYRVMISKLGALEVRIPTPEAPCATAATAEGKEVSA